METQNVKKIALFFAIGLLLPAASLWGDIWYVDADAPAGGDGTSWATAFRDLQSAINAADPRWMECMAPYDHIYVKSGIYVPASTITINKVVDILGGFPNSVANPTPAQRNWKTNLTIVSGGDLRRCFHITRICELNGFYIQNGYHTSFGGAVFVDNVDPVDCLSGWLTVRIRNCWIRFSEDSAVYDDRSDVTIQDCIFSDNSASAGGAIYHTYSSPLIERCKFYGNEATGLSSVGGGAIGGFYGNVTTGQVTRINDCLFYENTSANHGGAISYNQGYPRIKHCTFANNTAANDGGAYYADITDAPRIWNSICWDNSPDQLYLLDQAGQEVRYCDIEGGYTGINGSHNINKNPRFVDAATDNYHLQSISPCIDTASEVYGTGDDLDKQDRPLDGDGDGTAEYDMGAYEYSFVDLMITAIETRPYKPAPLQAVDIDVTVVNQGTQDATQPFYVDWYANRAVPPVPNVTGNRWAEVDSLGAGETIVVTLSSWNYGSAGAYSMYAQVDTEEDVAESNETNNIFGPQTIHVNTCRADINEDNHVDLEDMARIAKAWLSSDGEPGWDRQCDLTEPGDGEIGIPDMSVLADDWLCKEP